MAQHAKPRIDTGLEGFLLRPAIAPGNAVEMKTPKRAAAAVLPKGTDLVADTP